MFKSGDDQNTTLSIAVAVIGILGVMVGGVVTYFGNRSLQEEQADRSKAQVDAVIRGTARVLQGILRNGDLAYRRSLQDCRYRLYNPETRIPLEDRKRLASAMDPREWDRVAQGLDWLRLQYERSLEPHPFAPADVTQIRVVREKLLDGQRALERLAKIPAPSPAREEVGGRCRA